MNNDGLSKRTLTLINDLTEHKARCKDANELSSFIMKKINNLNAEIYGIQSICNHIYEDKVNPHFSIKTCKICYYEIKEE